MVNGLGIASYSPPRDPSLYGKTGPGDHPPISLAVDFMVDFPADFRAHHQEEA